MAMSMRESRPLISLPIASDSEDERSLSYSRSIEEKIRNSSRASSSHSNMIYVWVFLDALAVFSTLMWPMMYFLSRDSCTPLFLRGSLPSEVAGVAVYWSYFVPALLIVLIATPFLARAFPIDNTVIALMFFLGLVAGVVHQVVRIGVYMSITASMLDSLQSSTWVDWIIAPSLGLVASLQSANANMITMYFVNVSIEAFFWLTYLVMMYCCTKIAIYKMGQTQTSLSGAYSKREVIFLALLDTAVASLGENWGMVAMTVLISNGIILPTTVVAAILIAIEVASGSENIVKALWKAFLFVNLSDAFVVLSWFSGIFLLAHIGSALLLVLAIIYSVYLYRIRAMEHYQGIN